MAIDIVARAMAAHADSKAISAYQYAVEGGYTGTEEEFRAEVALMAENAQAVNNAVRFDLEQDKTDEQKMQAQENLGVDTDKGSLQEQLDNKANKKGYYDEMGVGTADNLTTNLIESNGYPFNFAPTGGLGKVIEAANRVFLRKIIYGSVVVNQLIEHGNFDAGTGWAHGGGISKSVADNKLTITALSNVSADARIYRTVNILKDHVYFAVATITPPASKTINCRFFLESGSLFNESISSKTTISMIYKMTGDASDFRIYVNRTATLSEGDTVIVENVMLVDITKWYGLAETADHIYAMETANAGDGVNFFVTQHPQASGYIPPNTGTLCSSKPSFHKTSDLNWWDEETANGFYDTTTGVFTASNNYLCSKNLNRCEPNTTYYVTAPSSLYIMLYDIDGNFIAPYKQVDSNVGWTFTTPSNGYFFAWWQSKNNYGSQTYRGDICFIDHYDDTMNGVYEAANIHTYPFDSTAEGHGIFKFKKVNNVLTDELYADGDEYLPSGVFDAKYANGKLSDFSWTYVTNDGDPYFMTTVSGKQPNNQNMICTGYPTYGSIGTAFLPDKMVGGSSTWNRIYIRDLAYTDTTTWLAAHGNDELIYPLATPTTSQKDPYDEEQVCHNWGYEYYNDAEFDAGNRTVQIPVGMVADYSANLKDKLEVYPNLPAEDGSYMLMKNGNAYSYVKFASSIPAIPTTDGTYTLKATVSGGTTTLSWEAGT